LTRRKNHGLPSCVVQLEDSNKIKALLAKGTAKGTVLEGGPVCPNVVAFIVFNTKLVLFLLTCVQHLRWIEKNKKVSNTAAGCSILMRFLVQKLLMTTIMV